MVLVKLSIYHPGLGVNMTEEEEGWKNCKLLPYIFFCTYPLRGSFLDCLDVYIYLNKTIANIH